MKRRIDAERQPLGRRARTDNFIKHTTRVKNLINLFTNRQGGSMDSQRFVDDQRAHGSRSEPDRRNTSEKKNGPRSVPPSSLSASAEASDGGSAAEGRLERGSQSRETPPTRARHSRGLSPASPLLSIHPAPRYLVDLSDSTRGLAA